MLQLVSITPHPPGYVPVLPTLQDNKSTPSVNTGPRPYADLISDYFNQRNGGDTYTSGASSFSVPKLEAFERVTLNTNSQAKNGMGLLLHQATDLAKPVAGYQHLWTHDPFLDFSVTTAASAEEAEARYIAALGNGVALDEVQKSMEGSRNPKDPLYGKGHPLSGRKESADVRTVTEGGTVLTLVTPGMLAVGLPANYSMHVTSKSGVEITLPVNEDARINEYENGYLSLYYPATGVRKTFDAAGQPVEAQDVENWGTSGQDIIVNVTGDTVDTGDGNDIVFNMANNARITGTGGNKTVYMLGAESKDCTLDLGNGNNTVFGNQFTNTNFALGTGKNSLMTMNVTGGSITGGGETSLLGNRFTGVSIDLPSGSSYIRSDYMNECTVKLQGNNTVNVQSVTDSVLNLGGGNNNITISGMLDTQVSAGNGRNSFAVDIANNSQLNIGNGKNNVSIGTIDYSQVSIGNGNNTFSVTALLNGSSITALDGNNVFNITSMNGGKIQSGNGRNSIFLERGMGSIQTGTGNDTLYLPLSMTRNPAAVSLGGGNDTVYVQDSNSERYMEQTWIFR